jgi:anti-sigma regulatory factor (Ser/Thr protein kinase)
MQAEQPTDEARGFRKTFRPVPESAHDGRVLLRTALRRWGLTQLYDSAAVVLSELIANAIRSEAMIELTCRLSEDSQCLQIEVRDQCVELPKLHSPSDDEETGRGLVLVDAISDDWGFRPEPGGKVVYAVLNVVRIPG